MWVTGGVPVTHLRKMMLDELQRRNFSEHTIRYYIRTVEDFARHFNRPPDRLGPRHIREYQVELFQKRKLSPGSVAVRLAALRFFYIKTLKKSWSVADTPYPKKAHRLPTVLSREEVAELLHAARTPSQRILLMTLYATGAHPAPGCSPATIVRIGRSIRKPFGTRATKRPSAPASRNTSIPTRCAIVSQRISMRPAPISAPFRFCSGTKI